MCCFRKWRAVGVSSVSKSYVAGLDFGSESVRLVIVNPENGETVESTMSSYQRFARGLYCEPRQFKFRQHPLDYLEALEECFAQIQDPLAVARIRSIAVCATGSTIAPLDGSGSVLAEKARFAHDPDAMFWMWKDRTSFEEASYLDDVFSTGSVDYTKYQGRYNAEWWWAKILRAKKSRPDVFSYAVSWMELCDWIPFVLGGAGDPSNAFRSSCAAGHKVLWNSALGGMISAERLRAAEPGLETVLESYRCPPVPAGRPIGRVSTEWSKRLGLSEDVALVSGSLDAHAGAVGAGVKPGTLVKVVGTSTVDLFVTDYVQLAGRSIRDTCGLAEDSIIPGHLGGEAGQAAFGDLFKWYKNLFLLPLADYIKMEYKDRGAGTAFLQDFDQQLLRYLDSQAEQLSNTQVFATDWINGRRYPLPSAEARLSIENLSIGDTSIDIYRALVEAAVMGSKAIYDSLKGKGITFERAILVGGITEKTPYICQLISSALGLPVMVSREKNVCGRGAALFAAVGAEIFPNVEAAQTRFVEDFREDYSPGNRLSADFMSKYSRYTKRITQAKN